MPRADAEARGGVAGAEASSPQLVVGLAQIGALHWEHRKSRQYRSVGGVLVRKPSAPSAGSFVYLPYSVGLLQAYVERHADRSQRYEFLPLVYGRPRLEDAVAHLSGADVVGFSCYVWNVELSLRIAEAVKQRSPGTLVVLGGPQVPDVPEAFLRAHPFVDVVCHGEGERAFAEILAAAPTRDWSRTPSVSFLDGGRSFTHPLEPRMRDLAQVPSPYAEGVFAPIMDAAPDQGWLATWETNRGCPFSCAFCDWGSATASKVNRFDMQRLAAELEWFADHGIGHLFVVDANFGILPRDIEITELLIETFASRDARVGVSVQSAKNATERSYRVQHLLATAPSVQGFGVTLSMQSLNADTLKRIKRDNISLQTFRELQWRFLRDGIPTYTDLIIGLPGETYDSFADGIATIIAEGQHNRLAIYNCGLLPNADMGDPGYQAEHGIESVRMPIVHEYESRERTARVEVKEYLEVVVATSAMTCAEWVRARAFASAVELLHMDRVLQIPLVVLAAHYGIGYRAAIEALLAADGAEHPVCARLRTILVDNAVAIQRGEPEFVASEEYLDLSWPVHQYALVALVLEGRIDHFYAEALRLLEELVGDSDPGPLRDAISLNQAMLIRPSTYVDVELDLEHNVFEFYRGVVDGERVALNPTPTRHRIDRTSTVWLDTESWCEDVIMSLYQRDALLYRASSETTPARALARSSPA